MFRQILIKENLMRNAPSQRKATTRSIQHYLLPAFCVIGIFFFSGVAVRAQTGPPFVNPPFIRSSGGVLTANLTVGPATVTVAGVPFKATNVYNGLFAPPVLRVKRGDVIKLKLTNTISTSQPTNLHYHGFAVSPLAPSDDIFISIPPAGGFYNYTVNMPANHAQGMFWYHPHPHGISEPQVLGGMSGGMIVEGLLEATFPQYAGVTERIMLLKDTELNSQFALPTTSPCYPPGNDPSDPTKVKTVNGLCNPAIGIRPGEIQFLRIANVGADAYMNLQWADNTIMYIIAVDGNATTYPIATSAWLLPPGARVEALVQGGPAGRTSQLNSLSYNTGPAGDPNPTVPLAALVSSGTPVKNALLSQKFKSTAAAGRKRVFPTIEQVRDYKVTKQRTFTFSENNAGDKFCINGCQYDMNRVDTTVNVGDVEEWTLLNTSGEVHAFHIHQLDFLVTEINGVPITQTGLQDTINIPYQVGGTPGQVKIKLAFTNPNIVGEFVYHCHILEHEDAGMMANIVVLPTGVAERKRIQALINERRKAKGHSMNMKMDQACVPCTDAAKKQ